MPRSDVSVIAAACIVAAALIVSASIIVRRPASGAIPASAASVSAVAARPAGTPPISQASVQEQFQAQVLAAPTLHSYHFNGKAYTLTDIKVTQVVYTAKDDDFTVNYNFVWQPAMPASGPHDSLCLLKNDGYGRYYDTAVISGFPTGNAIQSAFVTIK